MKNKKVYKIIVFGPQGAGKGTQAEIIEKDYDIPVISVGNLLRVAAVGKSKWGRKAAAYMKRGALVPDMVVNNLLIEHLKAKNCARGFVLDGYPRNLKQLKLLTKLVKFTHVFNINISDKEAVKRIKDRLSCSCGRVFHKFFNPPKRDMRCDFCREKLYVREDDRPAAVKKRLKIYRRETEPLVAFYKKQEILYDIDGSKGILEVYREIKKI
ncbi:MAG: nucleoside monophosphate kinase [Patescibacteria group bacterium]|nr:nucleoside monophosphate kinase [Patescibacteria group bacterium]MDD5490211.1 nucleoside monophosphate kinase [Patescibacteria group bacterium]